MPVSRVQGPGRVSAHVVDFIAPQLEGGSTVKIKIKVNGRAREDDVEPRLLLVHYLRDVAGLTGTHIGCETSICGACTVMLNGDAVKSCTMFAVQADGGEILTIEGLGSDGHLHPLQQ